VRRYLGSQNIFFALNSEVFTAVPAGSPELFIIVIIVPQRIVDSLDIIVSAAVRTPIMSLHPEAVSGDLYECQIAASLGVVLSLWLAK